MCAKSFENPLIPHKRLRELFTVMVETRALGGHVRTGFARGTEACWVGTSLGLAGSEGDLVSAGAVRPLLDYVLGARLRAVLKDRGKEALNAVDRMFFALGAASQLKAQGKVALAYAYAGELAAAEWKRVLTEAQRLELPVVFVAVPEKRSEPGLAELALKCGVAGIAVDGSDAIALYRVAQESIGRARAGGGCALIEGVNFPATGDALALLARQLVAKGAASDAWLSKVEPAITAKLLKETAAAAKTRR